MVSRYDNRRACIAPYNSKIQFEYTTATEIHEVSRIEEGRECTERCNWMKACAKGAVSLRQGKSFRLVPLKVIAVPTMRCGTPNLGGGDGVSSGDDSPGSNRWC